MHLLEMLLESDCTGAELPAEMTDEHRGLLLVGGLHVKPELLLLRELGGTLLLLAPEHLLPVTVAEHPVNILLVPVDAVPALELLPADLTPDQGARVDPEVLVVADLGLELLLAELAPVFAVQVYLGVLHQVTGGLEPLLTSGADKVPSVRILVDGNLVFPHIGSSDGGVAAVGTEVRLWIASVTVKMVCEMTPGFECLGTVLVVTDKQAGAVLVTVDVVLVLGVRLGLEAQRAQFTVHFST